MMKIVNFTITFVVLWYLLSGGVLSQEGWKAPESAKSIENPVILLKESPTILKWSKTLYLASCATCHGERGKGDGAAGLYLSKPPTDLSLQGSQTDGELFWKIQTGRSPMPSFKDILSEKKVWLIINYLNTLRDNK